MQEAPTPEDQLLGRLLIGLATWPAGIASAVSALRPRHFATEVNREVFTAIAALHRANAPVNLIAFYSELCRTVWADKGRGAIPLIELWSSACESDEVDDLAATLIGEDRSEPPERILVGEPDMPFTAERTDTCRSPFGQPLTDSSSCWRPRWQADATTPPGPRRNERRDGSSATFEFDATCEES